MRKQGDRSGKKKKKKKKTKVACRAKSVVLEVKMELLHLSTPVPSYY